MATLIEELGAKWGDFTDEQRAALSEAIAGANQASVFQSLMSNIDVMKEVQSELNQGWHFGSALAENEQYVDSLSGKLNKLKETWVGVFNTLFNSEFAKGAIDGLIAISEAISTVITTLDDLGMLTPVLTGLGVLLTSKAFSGIGSIFSVGSREARGFASILPTITSGFTSMNPPATRFGATLVGMGTNVALAGTKIGGMLSVASSFIPWAVAAGVAVAGASAAIDYFTESLDEEKQRLNESISARKEEISSLEEQKGKLQEIQKEYDKLANKPKKTSAEVEKLNALTKELAQIKPELVVGYDESGNPILSMTGDVQDLIDELDRATESKKRLLNVEQEDSAKNSIKQLHGNKTYYDAQGNAINDPGTEMGKLEQITSKHIQNMNKLEKDRDKIINKLYEATGTERQKLLKDLDKANYEIEKAQEEYSQSYKEQLDIIKEYSDNIGNSLFSNIESSALFKGASEELQNQFSLLKQHLDFSDIKTEDQLLEAEYALNKLFRAAQNGDVDLGKLKSQLEKANQEFAKTQDSEKYAKSIENIIEQIKEIPGLENINIDILKDMFEGIDTSVAKGKDALDEFLRAYGKTKADLEKDDGFAKALVEQKRQLEDALNNLEITGKPDVDIEIAYDMISDSNLPEQLRDLIRTMINSGVDGTEVLKVTQAVLLDIQDGKIDNPEKLQEMIDEAFGEKGRFEITPEILMTDDTKIAGIETVIKQITDRFGEIPPVVKTVIEAEGITAFNEAKKLTEMYLGIPEEVRTVMTNNGMETLTQIQLVDLMLKGLPEEIVANILTNFPSVVTDAETIEQVISNLPASVLMEIKNNYPEVVEKSKLLQEAIDNIPATKESKISVTEEIKKDPMSLLDRLFGKDKTDMTATAVINSQVNNLDALKEFNGIWSSITGKGSGGSSSGGGSPRSIDEYSVNPITDEVSKATRAAKNTTSVAGGSGFNATVNVTVNGVDELQRLQELLTNFTINDINATVSVHTSVAAQNLSGLIVRINQTKTSLNTLSSKNVTINTAQSAKNLSGLIVRVNQYKSAIDGVGDKTTNVHTAQAAKNISGLISKIDEYNDVNPKAIVFKTNASTVTSQVKTLLSSIKSVPTSKTIKFNITKSGSIPNVNSRSIASPISDFTSQVQADTLSMQKAVRAGLSDTSNTLATVSKATLKTPIAITGGDIHNSIKYSINLIKELENRIDSVGNSLSTLDKKMEKAVGKEKIQYLQQQNTLYQEQLNLQKELEDKLIRQRNYYKAYLEGKGVKFNSDGNATNYEELLLKKEKELESLEKIANKEKATDAQKNAYENAKNALEEFNKFADAYFDVAFNELPKIQEEWESISNSIKENTEAIKNLAREQELYTKNTKLRELDMLIDEINDKQDLLNEKMSTALGDDKVKYQEEYIQLLNKEIKLQEERIKQYESSLTVFQKELSGFGFNFDISGTIQNLDEILNKYQNSKDLEYLNNLLEEYFEIQRDNLPDAKKDWEALKNEIDNTATSIDKVKKEIADLHVDSGYKDHERDLAEVENDLAMNQIHLDNSVGKNYLEYLSQRIDLTHLLKKETQDLLEYENSRRKSLMSELGQYGFNFREDGSIAGYGGKIAQLKESLSEEEFEEVFSKIEDYLDSTYTKIPELQQSFEELGYEISDYEDELESLIRQRALDFHLNKIKEIENEYDKLADKLDIIDIKLKHAWGQEKLDLLDEQIKLLEDQTQQQYLLMKKYQSMAQTYQVDLKKYGVEFDFNGDITNINEILNKYQDHKDIEKLKELIDEYLEIQRETLPDVQKEWEKLNSTIKDAYKEQLEVTKEIEDKILQVYKKQLEERKKLIDEELDAKLKALKKEQDAYNKAREEADYKSDYEDQLDVIKDLEKKIEIAKKDTSLSGQKKLQELLEKLAAEQKELEEMVQDKIDSDVNNMYDKESERLEEEAENLKDILDEQFSDERLQQLVKDALTNGVFVDIDGNIKDLQDTLLEFEDKFGEGMTAIGAIIKSELVTNLEIAKEAMKDLGVILGQLNLKEFAAIASSYNLDMGMINNSRNIPVANSNSVNFNSPLIVVEGNVDSDVVENLEKIAKDIEENVVRNIVGAIR